MNEPTAYRYQDPGDIESRFVPDRRRQYLRELMVSMELYHPGQRSRYYESAIGRRVEASRELTSAEVEQIIAFAEDERRASAPSQGELEQLREDSRRLAQIASLLGTFDWEFADRQHALESIERIVHGREPLPH